MVLKMHIFGVTIHSSSDYYYYKFIFYNVIS